MLWTVCWTFINVLWSIQHSRLLSDCLTELVDEIQTFQLFLLFLIFRIFRISWRT